MGKEKQYEPPIVFCPGETLGEKLREMSMGPKEFALRTGKPEKTIIAVLKGHSSITAEMAMRFENVTGIPAHFWLNCQQHYDEFVARKKRDAMVKHILPWAKKFPLREMSRLGWLPDHGLLQQRAFDLLAYFGFASPQAWEDYYFKQELRVAFRISLAKIKEPYALSAWLRQGELVALTLPSRTYSYLKFKSSLKKIKNLMSGSDKDILTALRLICLEAGVKLVATPALNRLHVIGATRWINGNPVIQLTTHYSRIDQFWLTFFHEAGHILLHGKKDIFLELGDHSESNMQKEEEADRFAMKWIWPNPSKLSSSKNQVNSKTDIMELAKRYKTHPSFVITALRHHKVISHQFGRDFFYPITISS